MRNRLINGNMQVWQRGTSGFTTLNNFVYVADRMYMFSGLGMNATASQATSIGLSGFQYAMRAQRNSGNTATTALLIGQTIETVNCYDLAGKTITISLWARAGANYSASGNALNINIVTGTGTDQGTSSYISSGWTGQATTTAGTATLTTSWQQFTYSFAVPSGTNEIAWYAIEGPTGTAGANDYFDVTGVQLEVGTKATPYEMQIYSDQLAQCQRYLPVLQPNSGGTTYMPFAIANQTNSFQAYYVFKVTPRVPPTGIIATTASGFSYNDSAAATTATGLSFLAANYDNCLISGTVSGGLTQFRPGSLQISSTSQIQFTGCEL
jgi:hypothetical protein